MVTEQLQREFVDSNQSCFCRFQAVFAGPCLRLSGFRRNALGSSRASRHFSSFRIPPKFHRTQSYFLLRLSDGTQERWDAAEPESVGPRLKARGEVLEARFFEFWKRGFFGSHFSIFVPVFSFVHPLGSFTELCRPISDRQKNGLGAARERICERKLFT